MAAAVVQPLPFRRVATFNPCLAQQGVARGAQHLFRALRRQPFPRAALRLAGTTGPGELMLRVHPEVARALRGDESAVLAELERELGTRVLVQEDPALHRAGFDILEV